MAEQTEQNGLSSPTWGQGADDFLFVYGTLRLAFGLELMQEAGDHLVYTGVGRVKAALYDLGDYPGAVKEDGESEITGDIFEVRNAKKLFPVLDEYEGNEYEREKVKVTMDNGKELDTWIYWYRGSVDKERRIKHSDYLEYLKNKKEANEQL